jgi:hypothetical protein
MTTPSDTYIENKVLLKSDRNVIHYSLLKTYRLIRVKF